jgi:hypothetical protein
LPAAVSKLPEMSIEDGMQSKKSRSSGQAASFEEKGKNPDTSQVCGGGGKTE